MHDGYPETGRALDGRASRRGRSDRSAEKTEGENSGKGKGSGIGTGVGWTGLELDLGSGVGGRDASSETQLSASDDVTCGRETRTSLRSSRSHRPFSRLHSEARWKELSALIRAVLGTFASLLFVIGCLCWLIDYQAIGTIIFAAANFVFLFTGLWWAISTYRGFEDHYTKLAAPEAPEVVLGPGSYGLPKSPLPALESPEVVEAYRALMRFEVLSATYQIMGAVAFNAGCATSFLGENWAIETLCLWFLGSLSFLLQGLHAHLMIGSCTGPVMPLLPRPKINSRRNPSPPREPGFALARPPYCCHRRVCIHRCIPAALFNTVGSILFTVSSVCLFYPRSVIYGAWGYFIGSCFYYASNWADTVGFLDSLSEANQDRRLKREKGKPENLRM